MLKKTICYSEDGGNRFFWNIGVYLPDYVVSYAIRLDFVWLALSDMSSRWMMSSEEEDVVC